MMWLGVGIVSAGRRAVGLESVPGHGTGDGEAVASMGAERAPSQGERGKS